MKSITPLILLTTLLLSLSLSAPTSPLIQTNNLKLHRTSSNIRLDQQFTLSFQQKYNSPPVFVYGISQYYLGALHLSENVSNFLFSLSSKQAQISVRSFGSTNFQWLAIAFLAVQRSSGFQSDSVEDGYISSAVSGNHFNQTHVTKSNLVFQGANYTCLPMLRGFLWNHTKLAKQFGLSISVKIESKMSYSYRIDVPVNFTANEVAFDVLFFNEQSISRVQVVSTSTLVYSIAAADYRKNSTFEKVIVDCDETVLLLGLKGFITDNYLANRELGWNSSCLSTAPNNTKVLSLATFNWKKIEFSFVQLRMLEEEVDNGKNSSNYTDHNSTDHTTIDNPTIAESNSIPIYVLALGAVGGIMLLAIVGVIIKKSCKRLEQRRELVPQQNFRSFPTISL